MIQKLFDFIATVLLGALYLTIIFICSAIPIVIAFFMIGWILG